MKAKYVDANDNILECDYNNLKTDNSIIIYKTDDLYFVRKEDLTIPCDIPSIIMEAYINNKDDRLIYFVNFVIRL